MAGIQSEQIIWPEAQYPEIKENIEGPRPENPDDTFLIEGATPYQQSEETPAVDLNSPDLISDPQDEQDYPSQSMNPTLFQTGDNPDLSEIMRSRDLVGAAYPAFRPFVRQLAAEGVPVSRTHEALAMLEDQLRATMKPDELDMYFGRNDDSRWVERFLLETNWTDRLSRELGITGQEAAERLEVAKKTGLSLRLLSDPAVFKKALEGKKLSDSKKEAVKNNYRIEDLQDKIGRSSTSDMFTVLETEWWGNKNLTDEQKKYLDSNRKARKELYNKVADLRNVIYTSRAADILGSGASLFTQQFITPLPEIMRNAAMLFGLTTATGLAVPEIADASAVALPGTYGLVTSALGTIVKLGVNHPFSAAMLLGGAAITGAAFEHTMMLEGGMLYDEILDALDEGADAFQKEESARAAQDSNYTARKPWDPAKNRLLAAKLALIGGAINGYIEIGNMGIMLNTVSGGAYDRAKDMLIKSVGGENGMLSKMGKRQLKSWAARALKDYAINYIKSSGTEGLEEYLQSLFSNTLLELGKAIAGKSNRSAKEVLEAIHQDGWGGFTEIAKGMLVTGIPGGVINAGARYQESVREKAIAAQPKLFSDDQAARIEAEKTLRAEDAEHVPTSEIKTESLSETGTQGELKTAAPDFAYDPANVVTGIEDADVKASAAPAAEPEQTPSPEAAPTPETQPEQADKQPEQTEETAEPAVPAAEQETEKAKTELRPASPERVGAAYQETVLPSSVYVSSEAMDAYLQTLPENERETLRQVLRMRRVDKTGEYLMRAKDFVAAGKRFDGLERAVADDVRRGSLGMTRRELTSIKDKVKYKESDPMEGSSQIAVEAREVRDDMTKKLRAIGYSQEQAEVMADAQAHAIFGFSRLYGIDPATGNWTGEVLSPKAWYEQLEIRRAQQQTPQESAAEAAGTIAQDNNGVFNQELFQPEDYDENGNVRPEVVQEIENELAIIRSEAEKNGTYLKAPNGQPSNLKAGAWELVRTKRFKNWFGDWEAAQVAQEVRSLSAQPLNLSGVSLEKKEAEARFAAFGEIENERYGVKATFPNNTAGKILRHKGFDVTQIIDSLPELFRTSVLALSEPEIPKEGHKPHNNIRAYHHFVNKFTVTGKDYYIRFTAYEENTRKPTNRRSIHSTAISAVDVYEDNKKASPRSLSGNNPGVAEQMPFIDTKIANLFDSVNGVSQVVDANGEPKIVYHGTSNIFDSFDKTRVGSHFGLPATGRLGFYFTNDDALANDYAAHGYVMPVFLRINNPLVIEDTGWGSAVNQTDARESDLRRWAQEGEHDGIIVRSTDEELLSGEPDTVYVAFEPEQIKSVDNRGTFDAGENIFYQPVNAGIDLNENVTGVVVTPTLTDTETSLIKKSGGERSVFLARIAGKYRNADTQWEINLSNRNIDHALNSAMAIAKEGGLRYEDQVQLLAGLPQIIQNAKLIESHMDRYGNPDVKQVHRMYCPVRLTTAPDAVHIVKLTVKEYGPRFEATVEGIYRAYDAKIAQTKKTSDVTRATAQGGTLNTSDVFSMSIREMLEGVNDNFGSPYFQSAAPKSYAKLREQSQTLSQQQTQTFNQDAVANSIGNTPHGFGIAVNEKGQLVGGSNRFEQSAFQGSKVKGIKQFDWQTYSGTGEGGAAHGAGTYAAQERAVAEGYREYLNDNEYDYTFTQGGKNINEDLATALKRTLPSALKEAVERGGALELDDYQKTVLANLQERAETERRWESYQDRQILTEQSIIEKIDANPGMTLQEFFKVFKQPLQDGRKVGLAFDDAYHHATQNAIRDGRDSATLADFRAVIEDDLKPMLLWRDDVLKDAEVLASADLAGINVERRQGGALYELDVPENDELLDEQKAFKEQSKTVKDSLRALYEGMTAQQKRDFAARLFPDKFTRGHEVELGELIRAFKEPAHLFELLSDATKSPPARNNARGALRSLGYTEEQLDRFYRDSDLARAEAARFAEKDAGKLVELQQQLEQERAANDAKEKQFLEKGIFNSLSRTTKISGRGIYNAIAYALRDDKMNDPRAASLALNDAGIKGITYDGRTDGRCFVIFDDNAIEIVNRYEQEKSQGQPRGSITFNGRLNEGGTAVIDLFKAADASTFLHESAHFLLQSYLDFGRMANAPAQLKQDLGVILNFLGVKDASEVGREQHEKWARTVELYFMEGKAPSSALAKVFARMKRWLLGIYHHARHLNTEITPEVREVLDRLYAGMNEEDAEVVTLSDLRQDDEAAAEAVARMEAEEAQEQQDAASPKTQNRRQASRIREALKRAAERRRKAQAELKAKQQERKLLKKEIAGILKKIKAAAEDKGILWAFQEKIRGVLAGYTLKNPPRQKLMQAMELYNYLVDHPGEMSIEDYAPADRAYIEMLGTTMLPDMTLGELRALGQHIDELREEGKKAYEEWKAARQQRRDQMWNECYAALGEIPSTEGMVIRGPQDLRKQYKGVKGKLEKAGDWNYAVTLGSHRLMDWIGNGHGKFNSAWTKYFIEAVNTAHDEYLRLRGDRYEALDKVLKANGLKKNDFGRVRVVDGIEYTVDEMLSVYALLKNEKGTKALLYGNFKGLGDSALAHAAHIVQSLTREELNVADAVLDDYEKHFDRLNRRFIEVYNEAMVKEEHYSPMKRLEYTSAQGLIDAESAETIEGRSIAAGRLAGLDKGFTIRRLEISEEHQQPVDLGLLSMWADQVTVQEHMYAFAQLTGDLSSVLLKRNEVNGMTMAKAIRMKYGTEAWNSVVGYTNIVTQNEARLAHSVMNGVTKHFIRGMSVTYLGLTLGSRLKQITSTPRFLMTVGLKAGLGRLVAQVGKWSINPARYMREAYRLDPQLKERIPIPAYAGYRIDPTTMSEAKYRYEEGLKATTYMLGVFDRAVAAIGWRATYENEIANGSSPEQAHHAAQRAVALTQQVPNLKDMPAFWRQNGLTKLMMVFSSNSIPIWGMTVYDLAQAIKRGDWPKSFVTTTALAVSAMATMFVSHGLPDGDDDDSLLDWMVDAFTEQTITSLPIVGKDLFAAYDELINKNRRGNSYSAFVAPIAGLIQGFQRVSSEKADEVLQSGLTRRQAGGWQIAEAIALLMGGFPVTAMRRIHTLIKSGDWKQALPILLAWQRQKKKATKKAVSW